MENDTSEDQTVRDANHYAHQALLEREIPTQGYAAIPGEVKPFEAERCAWQGNENDKQRAHLEKMALIGIGGHMQTAKVAHQNTSTLAMQTLEGQLWIMKEFEKQKFWTGLKKQGVQCVADIVKDLIFGKKK